jgi:hypothetical protein
MLEKSGDIILTSQYWDCECENNFIHPVECAICPVCNSEKDDQPDSRVNEFFEFGFSLPDKDLSSIPVFAAKYLGIEWLRKHVKLGIWPENDWTVLSPEYSMNIYIDDDDKLRAIIFPVSEEKIDLESPIEVI